MIEGKVKESLYLTSGFDTVKNFKNSISRLSQIDILYLLILKNITRCTDPFRWDLYNIIDVNVIKDILGKSK